MTEKVTNTNRINFYEEVDHGLLVQNETKHQFLRKPIVETMEYMVER